jgi:hypothetical protein
MPLGITKKPNLFLATVYKWESIKPDTKKRVRDTTNGTSVLLNTANLDGLRVKTIGQTTGCSLYYFENPFDSKCSPEYMEILNHTVAEVIVHMDTVPTHTHMKLPLYPKMDKTQATVDTEIPIANFSWAVAVADSGSTTDSLVWYVDSAWKLKRGRVKKTLAELLTLIA